MFAKARKAEGGEACEDASAGLLISRHPIEVETAQRGMRGGLGPCVLTRNTELAATVWFLKVNRAEVRRELIVYPWSPVRAEYRCISGVTDTPCNTIEAATTTSVMSASIRAAGADTPCDSA
jgi:hypothetical protein